MAPRKPRSRGPRCTFAVPSSSSQNLLSPKDPYYGQELLATLAARFITHRFGCRENPQSAGLSQIKLPYFIAYIIYRTKRHPSVTFAALVLLQRLIGRCPYARGSSGHRLFISAYMISSKVMCDDTYSNKSWCSVARGMFTLGQVNQMEREMCTYLDWELIVNDPILSNFEKAVRSDFRDSKAHYPNYPATFISKQPASAEASDANSSFEDKSSSPVSSTKDSRSTEPNTPDTPSPTFSDSISPTSSSSPPTPVGGPDTNVKICGIDTSPHFCSTKSIHVLHPLDPKMFAFAVPSGW